MLIVWHRNTIGRTYNTPDKVVVLVSMATLGLTLYPQLEKEMSAESYGILDKVTFYVSITLIGIMATEVLMHVLAAGLVFFTHVGYAVKTYWYLRPKMYYIAMPTLCWLIFIFEVTASTCWLGSFCRNVIDILIVPFDLFFELYEYFADTSSLGSMCPLFVEFVSLGYLMCVIFCRNIP